MKWRTLALVPVAAISASAYAKVYLTVEQAQAAIFPGEKLGQATLALTREQADEIARRTGAPADTRYLQAWRSERGDVLFVDRVVGKHELITFAVAVDPAGAIRQVEILEYREAYGYEVRDAAWRRQFVGKTAAAHLKLNDDIANVSGATLSCSHVTQAIRRLMAIYEVALKPRA